MKKVLLILTTTVLLQACGGGGSSPLAGAAVTPHLTVSALGSGTDPSLPAVAAVTFQIPKWEPQKFGWGNFFEPTYQGWMFTDISANPVWQGVAKIDGQWRYIVSNDCVSTATDERWLGCWDITVFTNPIPDYLPEFREKYRFDPLSFIKTFVGGTSYPGSADGWVIPVDGNGKVFGVVQIANRWQIVESNDCPYDCLNAELYDASAFNSRFGFNPLANLP
ncbi:MAG: hypothetical protein QM527_01505 [Alphaproteobacteria bacterium]|nr:hypothetical protein [Alphaproteobacteria bacterium]MDI9329993.1 hypothetical protein [Alphaproteobacteria bacterium]